MNNSPARPRGADPEGVRSKEFNSIKYINIIII